ncbi:MAG: hypothetical protein JWP01_566 [Myxococcales bacterium]|nr:hypothetical protein [Myxococcales bacterium]
MTNYRRVAGDGEITSHDGALSPEQVELLKRRCDAFPAFVADSPLAAEDFIRSILRVDPASYLANFDLFIDSIDEMVGQVVLDEDGRNFLVTRLLYFIAEYLIRRFRASWHVDAVPFSRTFGQYVIDIPLDAEGLGSMRVSPFEIATDYVTSGPPRSLRTGLSALVATIAQRS